MSWSNRRPSSIAAALAAALALSGCAAGFEPLAGHRASNPDRIELTFNDISLNVDSGEKRFLYHLDRRLRRQIQTLAEAPASLRVSVKVRQEGLAIEQDDSITRLNLTATGRYEIVDIDDNVLDAGEILSITALNAQASQFTTTISRRDAIRRLADDVGRRVIARIRVNDLRR